MKANSAEHRKKLLPDENLQMSEGKLLNPKTLNAWMYDLSQSLTFQSSHSYSRVVLLQSFRCHRLTVYRADS